MKTRIAFVSMLLVLAMQGTALAQQAQGTASNPPMPGFAPTNNAQPFRATEIGDTTRYLLQLQANGSQAGKPLPMLGDEATASYRRYLKSFDHPIPDFYETPLSKSDGGVK